MPLQVAEMTTQPDPSNESPWYEYLQSDLFWVLAILICLNCVWTWDQHHLLAKKDEVQEDIPPPTALQKLLSGIHLEDHITSRLRQYLTLLLCTLPLPIQIIHGFYVFKTMWRMSFEMFKDIHPRVASIRPRLLAIIMSSPALAGLLIYWSLVVLGGVLIVGAQIELFRDVWKLEPNGRPDNPLACEEELK